MSLMIVLKLLGAMSLLIYGMKVMSEALQKLTGPQLRSALGAMTANRFSGVASGALVTMAVQSSTATTVMTVSFVNAGLLTLAQAISVIMGANIGTTLTAWIMSAGFSFRISDLVWPAFFVGIILIYNRRGRYIGDLLYGLAFMLFSLAILKATGTELDLANNKDVVAFFSSFDPKSFMTILIFLAAGSAMTFLVHSSAAVMAITMILCSSGVLPIYQGIALVLGENIGTTLTANIAALAGNTQARRAAMAHLLFNVFGVIWVLCIFHPFVNFACSLVGLDPTAKEQSPVLLSFALAAFHTLFNVTNTFILIWFIPQFEKVVCLFIKGSKKAESADDEFQLKYITSGVMKTPEVSLGQANRELVMFAERVGRMFGLVRELYGEKDADKFNDLVAKIRKYESFCDKADDAIGEYLSGISNAHLSDDSKRAVRRMLSQLSSIESIGDCCYNLARTLNYRFQGKEVFSERENAALAKAFALCETGIGGLKEAVEGTGQKAASIDAVRAMRKEIEDLSAGTGRIGMEELEAKTSSYAAISLFKDLVTQCESACHNVFDIHEARMHSRIEHRDEFDVPDPLAAAR